MDIEDNDLAHLEAIHLFVKVLDKYVVLVLLLLLVVLAVVLLVVIVIIFTLISLFSLLSRLWYFSHSFP